MQLKSSSWRIIYTVSVKLHRPLLLSCFMLTAFVYVILAFCIPFQCAISIITKHKNGSSQESLSPKQLTAVIHDIFYAAEKLGLYIEQKNFNLHSAISILCNLLWNIFDAKRQQNISLMELKLALLILCELPPINTYHQLIEAHFEIAKDHNNCITRSRFEDFINVFGKLLSYIGEPLYLNKSTVNGIVTEVFANDPGINGISKFTFTAQFCSHDSTKFSSYTNLFLLFIRFKKSELVVHQNQCSSCHAFPIVGMRFKCQKCKGLSLCFACFRKGYCNARHSSAHRMFELCSNEKDHGKLCTLLMKFCNIFRRQPIPIPSPEISSVFEHNQKSIHDGNSKWIENEHVELIQIDDDIEGGASQGTLGTRRGTIRSEIFNNSENLLIVQRKLMERLLVTIESIKLETENYQQLVANNRKVFSADNAIEKFIDLHDSFLVEHIGQLKCIHDDMLNSLSSSQNTKTIKSSFTSPTTSLFLPHSSTPYRAKKITLKEIVPLDPSLCKSSKLMEHLNSNWFLQQFFLQQSTATN